MEIITRAEAKAQGLKRYFTGKPCKNGHVRERDVGNGKCLECKKAYEKSYRKNNKDKISKRMKNYRKANKEKGKVYMKVYRETNKDELKAYSKAYREANKGRKVTYDKAYREANKNKLSDNRKSHYEANKDKEKAYGKAYREANEHIVKASRKSHYEANKKKINEKSKIYRKANKEKVSEYNRVWRKSNKDKVKAYYEDNPLQVFTRRSLHRIERAIGKDRINRAELELGYTQDDFKLHIESLWLDGMSWDNRSEWHIDHIKPLSLFLDEGITDPAIINALDNLQPLWAYDNLSKGAKFEAA